MRMRSGLITGVIAVLAGAIAGLAGGAYVVHRWEPKQAPPKVVYRDRLVNPGDEHLALPMGASALPSQPVSSAIALPLNDVGEVPADQLPVEERQARWEKSFARKISYVESEGRDAAWASKTEQAFQKDFTEQADRLGAKLVKMDCRTTGCLAQVEWESFSVAQQRFHAIAHTRYETNCAVALDIGKRPEDVTLPHKGTVVFQCEHQRINDTREAG